MTKTIPPRFDLTEAQIDHVIRIFYTAIRQHETLGPVFARHVTDWPAHEAKIAGFWKKAILYQPGYDGNPMRVHLQAEDVRGEHFPLWLSLFDEVLDQHLPPLTAKAWSALAHRIGGGLRLGVDEFRRKPGLPPMLT